jgi:hypothetical protein
MRFSVKKKIPVIMSDVLGLDFKNAQSVNAALMTSGPAAKAVRVQFIDQSCIMIDALVEALKISHLVFAPFFFS